MKWLRWVGPWIVGFAILAALFARVEASETWRAFAKSDFPSYLLVSFVFIGLWLMLDAFALTALLPGEAQRTRASKVAWMRAATYPLFALNFHLASAAFAASLARELRVPMAKTAGTMLAYYVVDLLALSGLALLGSLALGIEGLYVRGPLAGLVVFALAILFSTRIARDWLRRQQAFAVLSEVPPERLLRAFGLRAALHASFAAFVALASRSFDIDIPWSAALAHTPLVLAVGALPISIGGLGTAQAALVFFFGAYASDERLLAFGLAYTFTLLVLRLPVGVVALWVRGRGTPRLAENGI